MKKYNSYIFSILQCPVLMCSKTKCLSYTVLLLLLLVNFANAQRKPGRASQPKLFIRHAVKNGETFQSLGNLYRLSPEIIASFNNIENYDGPVIAMYLYIPLNNSNFLKTVTPMQINKVVPVYHINGQTEHLVLLNKSLDTSSTAGYKWSNAALATKNLTNLYVDGYLKVAGNAIGMFKAAKAKPVAKTKPVAKKTVSYNVSPAGIKTSHSISANFPDTLIAQNKNKPVVTAAKSAGNTSLVNQHDSGMITADSGMKERVAIKPLLPVKNRVVGVNKPVKHTGAATEIFRYIIVLFVIYLLMLTGIILYLWLKKGSFLFKQKSGKDISEVVIRALFETNLEGGAVLREELFKKRRHSHKTKQLIINEIINAKNNFKGTAAENLVQLYCRLSLDVFSLNKLQHKSWSTIVTGIQELSAMQQVVHLPSIQKLLNHPNEYVRLEAQCALVQLAGYDGLRFLDDLKYPLTEWHQIKLIDQLSKLEPVESIEFFRWLYSANDTIVILLLKTIASGNFLSMYQWVTVLLKHNNPAVKIEAIKCLKEIANSDTPALLQQSFTHQSRNCQLLILEVIGEIGCDDQRFFLLHQLSNSDDAIKMAAANALVKCISDGFMVLQDYCYDKGSPYTQIISQVKEALLV
ncbi:MAG: HEAT repeat domain-containing protein [Chitinophagaceae bacterium]|nr:HEAT repeat domain-containing protein [Chitinophagaceae bacterium]